MTKSAELREQRAKLISDAQKLIDGADAEKRGLNGEENTKWEALHADADKLKARIDQIERQEQASASIAQTRSAPIGRETTTVATATKSADERRAEAFNSYLRRGVGEMPNELREHLTLVQYESRDLSVGTGSAGGYLAPQGFQAKVYEAMKDFNGIRRAPVSVLTTGSGVDIPTPTNDDTSNTGELLGENSQTADDADQVFGQVTLKSYLFSSKLQKVSIQLIQDSFIDLDTFLGRKLGERIGRIQATYFTTGSGTGQPQGIVTGSGDSGITAASVSAWTSDELLDVVHSVDPAYRIDPSCSWMFNDTVLKNLKKLKDDENRPLWLPGLAVKEPDTFLGYPYVVNQAMPTPVATHKSVLFGAMSYFQIRDVNGVTVMRLTERFADYFQVGFVAFQRSDSKHMNSGAIKYATQAAS